MTRNISRIVLAALVLAAPTLAWAQTTTAPPQTTTATVAAAPISTGHNFLSGGYLTSSISLGDWADIAGFPLGFDATNVVHRNPQRPWAIRNNLGLMYNFSRTVDVPRSNIGPSDALQVQTKNTSLQFGIGPEISKPDGEVRPFVYATAGFDTYWTSSNLSGTVGGAPYYAQHGDSRIEFAWAAGLGIRRWVTSGGAVELSAEYRSSNGHRYLRPSEITASGTAVTADRAARNTDQILIRIGTVVGH
jgi:opacity protein-like surface antigen